jgi:hypothetical protein
MSCGLFVFIALTHFAPVYSTSPVRILVRLTYRLLFGAAANNGAVLPAHPAQRVQWYNPVVELVITGE